MTVSRAEEYSSEAGVRPAGPRHPYMLPTGMPRIFRRVCRLGLSLIPPSMSEIILYQESLSERLGTAGPWWNGFCDMSACWATGDAFAVDPTRLKVMRRVKSAHMVFVTAAAVSPDGSAFLTVRHIPPASAAAQTCST